MKHIRFDERPPTENDLKRIKEAPVVFPMRSTMITGKPMLVHCDCPLTLCLGRMQCAVYVEDSNNAILIPFHNADELEAWAKTLIFQIAEMRAGQ